VPLMLWFPPRFRAAMRPGVIGSHVDLAPTIAEVAGLPPAPDWRGRSLLDAARAPRAYFYVAEDHFRLGVREGRVEVHLRPARGHRGAVSPRPRSHRAAQPRIHRPPHAARACASASRVGEANRRQYARHRAQNGPGPRPKA
jgi:hypothetical protein